MVTNALQYLSHEMVDKIIVLGDGRVEEMGTFPGLSSDPNFTILYIFEGSIRNFCRHNRYF